MPGPRLMIGRQRRAGNADPWFVSLRGREGGCRKLCQKWRLGKCDYVASLRNSVEGVRKYLNLTRILLMFYLFSTAVFFKGNL